MSVPELATEGARLTATETLSLQRPHEGVVVLHLNRPERLNAINDVMVDELTQHARRAWAPTPRSTPS